MAKYLIKNPELKTIEKGPNKDDKFLYGTLENTDSYYDDDRSFVSFSKRVVGDWNELLTPDKGGKAEKETPLESIPDRMKYIYGVFAEYCPCCKDGFFKKYLSDNPRGKAGEYVKDKEGNPVVYKSMRVFCQYALIPNEETGKVERVFLQGQSVDEVGQRLFNAQCVIVTNGGTATAEDEHEPVPPATAEDNHNGKTITGYDPKTGEPIFG